MRGSLFVRVFVRLLLAAVLAVACAHWLRPRSLVEGALLLLAWCAAVALWASRALRRRLAPLQVSANALMGRQQTPPPAMYRDFDGLSYALASAASEVKQFLARTEESRRELEALLDSMQDAVVSVDASGRIQWSNERMLQLLPGPVPSGTIRIGHALVQTVRDPDVLACVKIATEQGIVNGRRATLLSPGRIFEVIASPMPDGGAVAVLHDITRIEQVEQTQRDFVANVSHELRTPLTSISGYVETLLDHEDSITEQGREFLATILKNTARMSRLTEDLLALARVEAASVKLNLVPVSAEILVLEAVSNMKGLLHEHKVLLELGELTSVEVMADPDSTLQILGNLIENGVKYGQPRNGAPVRVTLSARVVQAAPVAVEFSVRDNGPGIAFEHRGRIFERFYRVDKARSRASGGTGLGLSIARHMVQAQGGEIRVESEMNSGSNFLFTLPAAPEQESPDP